MSIKPVLFVNRRKRLKLTQRQVAEAVGITSRSVQRWELGEALPQLNVLQTWRLCQVLQCSIEDLARDFYPNEFLNGKAADSGGKYAN